MATWKQWLRKMSYEDTVRWTTASQVKLERRVQKAGQHAQQVQKWRRWHNAFAPRRTRGVSRHALNLRTSFHSFSWCTPHIPWLKSWALSHSIHGHLHSALGQLRGQAQHCSSSSTSGSSRRNSKETWSPQQTSQYSSSSWEEMTDVIQQLRTEMHQHSTPERIHEDNRLQSRSNQWLHPRKLGRQQRKRRIPKLHVRLALMDASMVRLGWASLGESWERWQGWSRNTGRGLHRSRLQNLRNRSAPGLALDDSKWTTEDESSRRTERIWGLAPDRQEIRSV